MTDADIIRHWRKGATIMTREPVKRTEGMQKAKQLKGRLTKAGIPFHAVYLYGSVARDQAHEWSDIDVAIVCMPFRGTRHEENMEIRNMRRDIDVRIEPVCLHPEDFRNRYFGLAHEIERTGMKV